MHSISVGPADDTACTCFRSGSPVASNGAVRVSKTWTPRPGCHSLAFVFLVLLRYNCGTKENQRAFFLIRWIDAAARMLRPAVRSTVAHAEGFAVMVAAVCMFLLLAVAAPGRTPTPQRGIKVVMDDNYPPYVFRNEDGAVQGILIDLWRAWEHKTGIRVDLHAMDWGEAQQRMLAGEFDVIDTLFKTEERMARFDFSRPYASVEVPIFFRQSISGITDIASLKGFPVAVKAGDAAEKLLENGRVGPLQLYNNYEAIIAAAAERKVNVFVMDKPPALYFLHKQGLEDEFRMSAPVGVGEFHRAVKKGNVELLRQVEKGFADVGEAEVSRITNNWQGHALTGHPYLQSLGYAALGGTILVALLIAWNRILAFQVTRHTADLMEREAQMRLYAEHSPAAIAMLDRDLKYLVVSRRWMEDYQLGGESIIGRSHYEVFPDIPPRWVEIHQRCLAGAVERCDEDVFVRADGRTVWLRWEIRPWHQGNGVIGGLIMFTEDITVRKQAEEMLREGEVRLMKVFRLSPVAITIGRRSDRTIVDINDAFTRLFGWTREAAVGHTAMDLKIVDEDGAAQIREALQAGEGSARDLELVVTTSTGETRHVLAAMETIELRGGPHVVSTIVDITGRKEAEQRIRRLNRTYAVLSDINQLIVRERDQPVILDSACAIAVEKGRFRMAWIGMADGADGKVRIAAHAGASEDMLQKLGAIVEASFGRACCLFTTRALQSGEPAVCNDIKKDQEAGCWRDAALRRDYQSMVSLPLKVEGKVVGTFNLYAHVADFFDENEMNLLVELANDIGFALEISTREDERHAADRRHARQRKALVELTSRWSLASDDALLMLRQIAETAAQTLNVSRVGIWRYNHDHCSINCVDLFEWEEGRHSSGDELLAADYPAYFGALEETEMIVADDARNDPNTREFDQGYLRQHDIRSMLDVPIIVGGVRTGVLCFEHVRKPRHWTADERTFALALTNLVSLALEGVERRQAEASLRDSERRFRQFAETIEEVFWMTDPTGEEMIYVSPAYEKVWHRTCASLLAAPLSWLEAVHPADRERVRLAMETKRTSGEYDETYRIRRPDGSVRWIHDRAFPVRDSRGGVSRIVGTAEDITMGKEVEAQLLRSQRMESIGTLAGGIAHDLNNVLAPIMMSIELLKLQEKDSVRLKILATIEGSAKRGADMVRQVLTFARGVEGQKLEVQLGGLLKEIEKIANDTFLKNIRIRSTIPADLWAVQGDPTQLHQVLLNLCVNARDAMPGGGVLTLSARNEHLDRHSVDMTVEAQSGPYVLIQVQDTGTGMPPEVTSRIFDPFFTTKEPGKGTGLGLSTSMAIIKSHGGFVRVHSEVGAGTRFDLYLPAHEAAGTVLAAPTEMDLPHGQDELVLLVDDEDSIRQITRQTLEAFGYRVLMAADGAEASTLYAANKDEIAVVLTDMMMPLMDGLATIQVLRKINPQVRIIAASGLNTNGMAAKAVEAGVKHFIPKPFTAETLLKTLHEVLHS